MILLEPEDASCTLLCGMRMRRSFIRMMVTGERVNPMEVTDDLYAEMLDNTNLLYSLQVSVNYSYLRGKNEITLYLPNKKSSSMLSIAVAILVSIILGIGLNVFSPRISAPFSDYIVSPLFDTMMNLLSTIVGPLIFLSVCSGIYSIGNLALVGRVAKKLMIRFGTMTFIPLIGISCFTIFTFQKVFTNVPASCFTASSSAAFATNIETCDKSFGISKKMVDFGVPIGQVVFMPAGAVAFLQLGIPSEGVALAISIDMLMDFVLTAANILFL